MVEEVIFSSESVHTRAEVGEYLQRVADRLVDGEPITVSAGSDEVTLDPPARLTFEVKAEGEGPPDAPGELSIEFELEWDEEPTGDLHVE